MTAEVAVMNAQAVALAADSAVSIRDTSKAFTSADKIFGVSAWEPVGAMIHGNAEFMGVPWETILKEYRRQLGRGRFDTILGYAQDFAKFLGADVSNFFPNDVRKEQPAIEIRLRLKRILEDIANSLGVGMQRYGGILDKHLPGFVEKSIQAFHDEWARAPLVQGLSARGARSIEREFAGIAESVQKEVFVDLPMTAKAKSYLSQLCAWFLTRILPEEEVPHSSGVVFAGFGAKQHFPHVVEYVFHGVVRNKLRFELRSSVEISRDRRAGVVAFGQRDMVQAFLDGIDPAFKDEIDDSLRAFILGYSDAILDALPDIEAEREKLKARLAEIGNLAFDAYRESIKKWRRETSRSQTLAVISALPKDELASVAESLVSLTSLKRRVSFDTSVAPPVDVGIISKHDGFVWVKKKHYFPSELNQRFNQRFNLRVANEVSVRGGEDGRGNRVHVGTRDPNQVLRPSRVGSPRAGGAKPNRGRDT